MKINSVELFDYIDNLKRGEQVKFRVYYDDNYVTEVLWDGEDFQWDAGTFTSGAFFNSLYDFEVIEEKKEKNEDNFTGLKFFQDGKVVCSINHSYEEKEKDIERLDDFESYPRIVKDEFETELIKYIATHRVKINELIDAVKELRSKE